MKKFAVLSILLAALMLLAGCHEGMIYSTVSITSRDGAGTKTVYVDILKDDAPIPGNKDGATVGNNSKFLLGGGSALKAKLEAICKLDGVTIKSEDKGQYERVSMSYSFSSIDDYNAKLKKLADGKAPIKDAVLKVDGDKVTFTEPASNVYNSLLWAIEGVYNDPAVFDKTGKGDLATSPATIDQMAKIYDVEVIVNGTSKKVNLKEMPQTTEISVTGIIKASADDATAVTNAAGKESEATAAENPKTSDDSFNTIIVFSILAIAAAAAAIASRKRFQQ